MGFWVSSEKKKQEETILKLEPNRCAWVKGTKFHACLARYEKGRVTLNYSGQLIYWRIQLGKKEGDKGEERDVLQVWSPGRKQPTLYRRLEKGPDGFEPKAMKLGKTRSIKKKEKKKIVAEMRKRGRRDQQVRSGRIDEKKMAKVDTDNTAYLSKTLVKVGWLDARRFGVATTDAAWQLAVHSGDLPLMLAALPAIQKDLDRKRPLSCENYATLFDRVRMRLGRRQRYGTQVVQDANGKYVVFPLEDRAKVDKHRKEIGLTSLAESLEMQKRWTGGDIGIQDF